MPGKITKITKNTAGTKARIYYDDGTHNDIPMAEYESGKSKWYVGNTIGSSSNNTPPPSNGGGGGGGAGDPDYFNVKDYGLKDELAKQGYISMEPGQDYIWNQESVGHQNPSSSKWTWDDESGFIRPSDRTYGAGALEDYKRRHGEKIEADYPGGWDAWVTDLKDPKLGHTNDNQAVRWLVGEVNKRSQELTGKDYVDVTKRGAYVPGVEIFNLPGIWSKKPDEEIIVEKDEPCPEGYEKNANGECVPIEEPCPDPVMVKDADGNCNCPPGMTLNPDTGKCEGEAPLKDEYVEKDKPWLPDRLNVMGAMGDRIFVGEPHLEQIDLEPSSVVLQTPDRMLANEKEAQNKLVDFIGQSGPMQSGVAAAIGATADSLGRQANIISSVEGANTDTLNRYGQYAAGVENQEEQYNKAALKRYVDERNEFGQNLSDERDMKDGAVLAATNRMLGNWYKKKWSEKVLFPQAYVDPDSGDPYWTGKGRNPIDPYDTYQPAYGGSGGAGMTGDQMTAQVKKLMEEGIDQDNATKMVLSQNQSTYRSAGRGNQFGYDPYTTMDFSGGSEKKRRSKSGGSVPFGVFLQGGIFE
jgi:hypothetical protein